MIIYTIIIQLYTCHSNINIYLLFILVSDHRVTMILRAWMLVALAALVSFFLHFFSFLIIDIWDTKIFIQIVNLTLKLFNSK